jgi:hypothetical protein
LQLIKNLNETLEIKGIKYGAETIYFPEFLSFPSISIKHEGIVAQSQVLVQAFPTLSENVCMFI